MATTTLAIEHEIATFFELTPDLVCIAGKDGFLKRINPAVSQKLGYTEKELLSNPISSFIHPKDRKLTGEERASLLNGKSLLNFQNRYITKSGGIVWLEWTSIYYPEKEVVFAIAKDITIKKQAEKEIEEKYKRFKSVASYFKSSLEENQKYLSVQLHEELAQLACVLKMDMDWISAKETNLDTDTKKRMEHALAVTDLLIKMIRRISFSISPNMLDDLGLNASLDWYCKEFSMLNGIPCSFKTHYTESSLTKEVQLDIFRICQESLTNIKDRTQANQVNISLDDIGENIRLSIVDDGKANIQIPKQKASLTAIRKRVASINGILRVETNKGLGTMLSVSIEKQKVKKN